MPNTIINGRDTELTNVNVGGVDIPPRSVVQNVTLTDPELAAVAALDGVAVMQATPTTGEFALVWSMVADALVVEIDTSTKAKRMDFKNRATKDDMTRLCATIPHA